MKIRSGFVSNSSSSSYVISFEKHIDLEDYFPNKSYHGDRTYVGPFGIEDVFKELKCWYGIGREYNGSSITYSYSDFLASYKRQFIRFCGLMSSIAREIDEGKEVAIINVAFGDDNGSINLNSNDINIIESFA